MEIQKLIDTYLIAWTLIKLNKIEKLIAINMSPTFYNKILNDLEKHPSYEVRNYVPNSDVAGYFHGVPIILSVLTTELHLEVK